MQKNKKYPYYEHIDIKNLKELLDLKLKECPKDIAFSYRKDKNTIKKTFEDVYNDVKSLSAYFNNKYENKHIALIGENSYNWIIMFMSIVISGNVCIIIDKDYDKELINKLLDYSDTKIVYYSKEYCDFINELNVKSLVIDDIDKYIKEGSKLKNKNKQDNDKEAIMFFTSGTTGPNKGVMLSERNICFDIYSASSIFKPNGSTISVLPYHHSFGLITGILKPYYYGVETFINDSLKNIMKDFKEVKPETMFVVPVFVETFYKQIWKSAKATKKDKTLKIAIKISNALRTIGIDLRNKLFTSVTKEFGGNLNYLICGGAYLDPKYIKWFRSIGIEILNGYGITECSPVVSVNRNFHHRDGSIGQICKDQEVKIIDEEICIKGENVMKGYYKDEEITKSVVIDGYFHTGDLGYIDNDGFLFVTGRKKNLIILSNGENISPELIESEIIGDEAVAEAVVYEKDNKLVVSIFPNEEYLGNQEYFDSLIYKYNESQPKNRQLSKVILRETEFIKNNNRKILRNKVEEENK